MKLSCTRCHTEVAESFLDLVTESALCPRCHEYFDCSRWINDVLVPSVRSQTPPDGTWFEESGDDFKVGAVMRSRRSLVVIAAASGATALLIRTGVHFAHVDPQRRDAKLVLIILIAAAVLFLWLWACRLIWGRVEVEVKGNDGCLFSGVKPIARTRKFDWSRITKVGFSKLYQTNRRTRRRIWLEGDTTILFGLNLRPDRQQFLGMVLRLKHRERGT